MVLSKINLFMWSLGRARGYCHLLLLIRLSKTTVGIVNIFCWKDSPGGISLIGFLRIIASFRGIRVTLVILILDYLPRLCLIMLRTNLKQIFPNRLSKTFSNLK